MKGEGNQIYGGGGLDRLEAVVGAICGAPARLVRACRCWMFGHVWTCPAEGFPLLQCIHCERWTPDPMNTSWGPVVICIGGKRYLGAGTLRSMKGVPSMVLRDQPKATLRLTIDGYNGHPWEIPEVADYIRRYAAAAGLRDWTGRLFKALDESSRALLIACDAIDKPHPFEAAK
jgi:hypothetical protein